MDDIDVDDIINKRGKVKRKNSGRKGKSGERQLCKILTDRFGQQFSRSIGSGNRWGQVEHLPAHARETFTGDVVCPTNFSYVIESKNGYEEIDLCAAFGGGTKPLDEFLNQAEAECGRSGRRPLLIWKKDRKPWIAFLHTADLGPQEWDYQLRYRNWTGVALADLLTLPDEFFFNH